MDLAHAKATAPAEHSLTMGDLTHAVVNEVVRGTAVGPDMVDPDETMLHLDVTAFDLTIMFGKVARQLGLLEADKGES